MSLYERISISNALQKAIRAIQCQHRSPNHDSKLFCLLFIYLHKLLGSLFWVTLFRLFTFKTFLYSIVTLCSSCLLLLLLRRQSSSWSRCTIIWPGRKVTSALTRCDPSSGPEVLSCCRVVRADAYVGDYKKIQKKKILKILLFGLFIRGLSINNWSQAYFEFFNPVKFVTVVKFNFFV